MSQGNLTTNENPHAKWLREVSKQIADAGHYGWGNTAEWAADEIDRLTRRNAELVKALERIAAHPVGQLAMIARAALGEQP